MSIVRRLAQNLFEHPLHGVGRSVGAYRPNRDQLLPDVFRDSSLPISFKGLRGVVPAVDVKGMTLQNVEENGQGLNPF